MILKCYLYRKKKICLSYLRVFTSLLTVHKQNFRHYLSDLKLHGPFLYDDTDYGLFLLKGNLHIGSSDISIERFSFFCIPGLFF